MNRCYFFCAGTLDDPFSKNGNRMTTFVASSSNMQYAQLSRILNAKLRNFQIATGTEVLESDFEVDFEINKRFRSRFRSWFRKRTTISISSPDSDFDLSPISISTLNTDFDFDFGFNPISILIPISSSELDFALTSSLSKCLSAFTVHT